MKRFQVESGGGRSCHEGVVKNNHPTGKKRKKPGTSPIKVTGEVERLNLIEAHSEEI